MTDRKLRATFLLAGVTGVLMAVQSATGMLFFSVYRDQQFALNAWRINDPVTLVVAVPLLFVSLGLARRGSGRGFLLLLGTMQYALYNYAFYLFGAALNPHFLLYVALFISSGLALITGLSALDPDEIARRFSPKTPVRWIAIYLGLWAGVLGLAWVGQAVLYMTSGQVPSIGAEPFRLIAALDLSLVVTPVAVGAIWLWARQGWGYILAVVMNVKGVIYAGLLSVGSFTSGPIAEGGGDGLLGLWLFLMLGSLASLVALLLHMRPAGTDILDGGIQQSASPEGA